MINEREFIKKWDNDMEIKWLEGIEKERLKELKWKKEENWKK